MSHATAAAPQPLGAGRSLIDPFFARLRRRALTISGITLALCLVTALLPALLVVALAVDLLRPVGRRTFASIRLALMLEAYLFTEVFGLCSLAFCWLSTVGSARRREALTFGVQRLYTGMHFAAVRRLFALRFVLEDEDLARPNGPLVVLVRHASIIDTLLPAAFIANRHGTELRYVVKRELLVDPCIDVAGHWLPTVFVARDGADSHRAIEAVRGLKKNLPTNGGVLLYPEGTRFTHGKRARALARLADDPVALAQAEGLRHVLPLRAGGVQALLDADPSCDVLFMGHSGLEGFSFIRDIWAGELVGRTIRVKFWREPAATVPSDRDARLAWLSARWQRLDDWLAELAKSASPRS